MISLSEKQEADLRGAVDVLFACAKDASNRWQLSQVRILAEQGRGDVAYLLCWDDFPNNIVRLLNVSIDKFFNEMMLENVDRYNALAGGKDRVYAAMRAFLGAPGEVGWTLAVLLAWEAGYDTTEIGLKHVLDAGVVLSELGERDQNYGIIAPGIAALHSRWPWKRDNDPDAAGVVDTLKGTLARAFAP